MQLLLSMFYSHYRVGIELHNQGVYNNRHQTTIETTRSADTFN